jgi:hypothetical protein
MVLKRDLLKGVLHSMTLSSGFYKNDDAVTTAHTQDDNNEKNYLL